MRLMALTLEVVHVVECGGETVACDTFHSPICHIHTSRCCTVSPGIKYKNLVIMTTTAVKELRDPNWILDRRNSGKLFWRRDSGDERKRVKFRCDVEVLEYLRAEAERSHEHDWSDEEDDDGHSWGRRTWEEEIPPPSSLWGGVCIFVIAAVLTYQWFSV
ncbi:uncharacterized protein LOC124359387 [Homalodisca vitripennis]|uniref:uncharacterized protein LOC124359387 n=1 Tax=Homalodisca vitripennis TaxID=197043 RepID=UPI001EEB1BC2|nr:uncharacterized protein LOC124359387 [Homalodisca vitripennis]